MQIILAADSPKLAWQLAKLGINLSRGATKLLLKRKGIIQTTKGYADEAIDTVEKTITINNCEAPKGPAFKSWNQFQSGTAGQFASRAEASAAWNAYKRANGIVTGTTRSAAARSNFLKGLANDVNTPRWMKQWLRQDKTPPGYDVDHILPLSAGGFDDAANMRLQLRELHRIHHRFYRPWE